MKTKICICTIILLLLLTSCSGSVVEPTVTPVDIGAIQTAAVEAIYVGLTQTVAAYTPTPESTATVTLTPTLSVTETPAITSTPAEVVCDDLVFISDSTVPDGATMTPGQEFKKTWKVKNTGSCTWKTNYIIVFGYGNPAIEGKMGGQNTAITVEVLPGAEAEISVNLKAPTALGTYTGNWRLQNNNGYNFGTPLIVSIVVK